MWQYALATTSPPSPPSRWTRGTTWTPCGKAPAKSVCPATASKAALERKSATAAIARVRGPGSGVSATRIAVRTKSADATPELPR